MSQSVARALSTAERKELAEHEQAIKEKIVSWLEVSVRLLSIRDKQLYRETHQTFEMYCRDRWDFTGRYARMLIACGQVIENLRADTNSLPAESINGTRVPLPDMSGSKSVVVADAGHTIEPVSMVQARALAKLPVEDQLPAWQEAVESAPAGQPTGEQVEAVVKRRKGKVVTELPKPYRCEEGDCEERFDVPNWHCPKCGKHNQYTEEKCGCGRKCRPELLEMMADWYGGESVLEKDDSIRDGLGLKVSAQLIDAFSAREKYTQAKILYRRISGLVNEIASEPGGEHYARLLKHTVHAGKFRFGCTDLRNSLRALESSEPYTICPYCYYAHAGQVDANCNGCNGTGYVTEQVYRQAPEAHKVEIEKLAEG